MFIFLFIALGFCFLLLIFADPIAKYLTHLQMVKAEGKPIFISYRQLLKAVETYKEDLLTSDLFPGYMSWLPSGERLTNVILDLMEHTPIDNWESIYRKIIDNKIFYWHASILYVGSAPRWLSPVGFFLFGRYALKICKNLPLENDFPQAMVRAYNLFEERHPDLVAEYNATHQE